MKNLLLSRRNILKISTSLFLFVLIFNSCSKSSDDPEPAPPTGTNCRLDSITGVLTYAGGSLYERATFGYDNQNRCNAYYFNLTYKQLYAYGNDDKVIRCDIFSGTTQTEERLLQYDAQGRMTGYTSTLQATNTASPDKLLINYTEPITTFIYLKNNDTLSTKIFYFENENNVRTEYYQLGFLVKIDSFSYGSALDQHYPGKEILILTTGAPTSKNLRTRYVSYDVTTAKRSWEENYTYEFDSDDKLVRKTIVAIHPEPTLNYRFEQHMNYSCR